MRNQAIKLIVTVVLGSGPLWASGNAETCQKPLMPLKNGEQTILNPALTGKLYQRAFLKLAQRLSQENLTTIESYAFTLSTRLSKEKAEAFKKSYSLYAQASSFEDFLGILKKADYWKSPHRLNNAYVALVAALAKDLGEIHLTSAEIEALWLSQNWPANDNLFLSKQLASISGALEKKRPLSVAEYSSLLRELGQDCSTFNDQQMQKKLREEFWITLDKSSSGSMEGRNIILEDELIAILPVQKLPDQTLRQGKALATTVRAFPRKNFRTYLQQRHTINTRENIEVIKHFHRTYASTSYIVVDKKQKNLRFFDQNGQELSQAPLEPFYGDELNSGGAGIYFHSSQQNSFHFLQAERDLIIRAGFKSTAAIPTGTVVYVLPENPDHHFRIRNQRLTFGATKVFRNRAAYNYSPMNRQFSRIRIDVALPDGFAKDFVKALQDEKSTLMGLLNIEDDEYNMLAEFAFGVLSPETNFGKNWKYQIKELAPVVISLLKGNGLDTDDNSRGPTQIKRIPEVIVEKYQIEKSDLKDPKAAAVATLAFSAGILKDLRNISHKHQAITEENIQDYLYYLYQGRRWEIRDNTATPERNASIQKIKKAIELLTISDI